MVLVFCTSSYQHLCMYQVSFQSLFAKIWLNTEGKSLIMKSSPDLETTGHTYDIKIHSHIILYNNTQIILKLSMHFDIRLITQEGNVDAGFIYFSSNFSNECLCKSYYLRVTKWHISVKISTKATLRVRLK